MQVDKLPATKRRDVAVRCAVCKRVAHCRVVTAELGSFWAEWLQIAPGWWVLATVSPAWDSPHARCPDCLGGANAQ